MPYCKRALGQAVGCLRAERGMSQEVLAGLAGISRAHLSLIENGRKQPRFDTLWAIAEALGLQPSELVRRAEAVAEADGGKAR